MHIQFWCSNIHICKEYLDEYNNIYLQKYNSGNKDTNNKILILIFNIFQLTVSVGCENIHVGSLQFGQYLQRSFFVATLLDNTSFCCSGVICSKVSFSNNFLFCSSVNSCFSSPSFAPDSSFVLLSFLMNGFCEGKSFLGLYLKII